jgi:hypothetical protein
VTDAGLSTDRRRLVERVDRLCAFLSQPLSGRAREAGWSPEAAAALLDQLRPVRERLATEGSLDPRELPDAGQAVRGMDAWGIDIASDSPLLAEVFDVSSELRGFARRTKSERR